MEIKILGTGCSKCKQLEKNVREIVQTNGIDATITNVNDIVDIMAYGVMTTPCLIVDEKIVIKGRVASPKELLQILT